MSSILDALKKLEEEKAARKAESEGANAFAPETPPEPVLGESTRPQRQREEVRLTPKTLLIGAAVMSLLLVLVSVSVSMALVRGSAPSQVVNAPSGGVAALAANSAVAPGPPAAAPAAIPAPAPGSFAEATPAAPVHATAPAPAAAAPEAEAPKLAEPKVAEPKAEPKVPEPKAARPAPEKMRVAKTETALPEQPSAPAPKPKPKAPEPAPAPESEPEPEPARKPAPEPEVTSIEAKDVAPVGNLKELPVLRTSDRISYGLENMRVNFLREATPSRPTAMAVINLNKIHIGEVIPNTKARLIAVERGGIGIEMADTGKRFYVPL